MTNYSNSDIKVIYVYRNGNKLVPPRKVVLNQRQTQSWGRVLLEVSKHAFEDKVYTRRLFTAESGTSIHSFSELNHQSNYVASDLADYIKVEEG